MPYGLTHQLFAVEAKEPGTPPLNEEKKLSFYN